MNNTILLSIHFERIHTFKQLITLLQYDFEVIIIITGAKKDFIEYKKKNKIFDTIHEIDYYFLEDSLFYFQIASLFKFSNKMRTYSFAQIVLKYLTITKYIMEYRYIKKILFNKHIIVSLLTLDRYITDGVGLTKYLNMNNIPIIIPHFMLQHFDDSNITRFKYNNMYYKYGKSSFYQKYLFNKYSKDIYGLQTYKDHFFYPIYLIEAANSFNTWTKSPWCNGGSQFSHVCLDSTFTYKRLQEVLKYSKSINIIGDLSYDDLYEAVLNKISIKQKIITKYNLNPNKQIIIFSLPQIFEHENGSKEYAIQEIHYIMDCLKELNNINLLLSLHPKMRIEEYSYLEGIYNCSIIDEALHSILPIADMYIPVMSSTTFWSILCGVRSCNIGYHDGYHHSFFMYDIFNLSKLVKNKKTLKEDLLYQFNRNISSQEIEEDWAILQKENCFDGKVLSRYIDLINKLSNQYNV